MMSINVRGFGSLSNALMNQTRPKHPEVGMGVTELMYSDRHPYTVVAILSPTRVQVQADEAIRTDHSGFSEAQEYTYTRQPDSAIITLRLNKHGRWKRLGDSQGCTYLIGVREEYYDFTR